MIHKLILELLEDLSSSENRDDFDQVVNEINEVLSESDHSNEDSTRVQVAIREIEEKLGQLPSKSVTQELLELSKKKRSLSNNAPHCDHGKMILRFAPKEENNIEAFFWSCPSFPDHFCKRSLTKEEKYFLSSERRIPPANAVPTSLTKPKLDTELPELEKPDFASFKEAKEWAQRNPGRAIVKSKSGSGFNIKKP